MKLSMSGWHVECVKKNLHLSSFSLKSTFKETNTSFFYKEIQIYIFSAIKHFGYLAILFIRGPERMVRGLASVSSPFP